MKRLCLRLLGLTLMGAVALPANAADIFTPGGGLKDGKYVPYWGGFYVGASIGAAGSETDINDIDTGSAFKNTTYGVFGGAQAGYNFQRGNYVFGPEIDLGGIGLSHSAVNAADPSIVSKIDSGFYFDATARLGYAMGQILVYAKGGYAYYDGSAGITNGAASAKATGLDGWTGGGGMEYSLNPAWSLKWEVQYFDFGTPGLDVAGNHFDNHLTVHTAKGGVNYHIGSVYEPLK